MPISPEFIINTIELMAELKSPLIQTRSLQPDPIYVHDVYTIIMIIIMIIIIIIITTNKRKLKYY